MKYFFICLLVGSCVENAQSQCKIDYTNYHLVLNEEFNTSIADLSTRWFFDTGDPEWIGAGIEYYDPGQISMSGGILRLKATKVPTTNMTTPSGRVREVKYKSGMIRSKVIVDAGGWLDNGFKYGIFEMRAKIPKGRTAYGTGEWDTWPAFWLTSGPTEIDIMDDIQPDPSRVWQMSVIDWTKVPNANPTDWEMICDCNTDPSNSLCSSSYEFVGHIDYPGGSFVKDVYTNKIYKSKRYIKKLAAIIFANKRHLDLSSSYNVYTGVWTPDKVTFFLNGVEACSISNSYIATYPHPCRIIANLEMMAGGTDSEYSMYIDYIRVWKPNEDDYSQPYKSSKEFMNRDISASTASSLLPSESPNSIAVNPNLTNEIFYRNQEDGICVAKKPIFSSSWNISSIPLNDGATNHVSGDVRYLPVFDAVLYVGSDNRINYFGRSSTEASGFYHWYISSNYSCYWCVTGDLVSTQPGSLQTTSNGEIFYRGIDNKMHWYHFAGGDWVHEILPSSYSATEMVAGDIVVHDLGNSVYYRGSDGRLQCFYKSGSGYVHTWIDENWTTNAYKVSSKPGSMVMAPSLNGVMYIGADNKIHLYYWDVTWKHLLIPYSYSASSLGYPNADLALNGVAWDDINQRLYYNGYDGRIQAFGKSGTSWWHNWVDDYWNTDEFNSFTFSDQVGVAKYASTQYGPLGIYYIRRDNHLAYFRYERCEILNPPSGYSPNLSKPTEAAGDSMNKNDLFQTGFFPMIWGHREYGMDTMRNAGIEYLYAKNDMQIIPNPSKDGFFDISISGNFDFSRMIKLKVVDVLGRVILGQTISSKSIRIDLSAYSSGMYFITIHQDDNVVQGKLIRN